MMQLRLAQAAAAAAVATRQQAVLVASAAGIATAQPWGLAVARNIRTCSHASKNCSQHRLQQYELVEQQQQGCAEHCTPALLQAVHRGWGWPTRTPALLSLQQCPRPALQAPAAGRPTVQHNQQHTRAYSSSISSNSSSTQLWQPWRPYSSSVGGISSSNSSSSCQGYVLDFAHNQPCPSPLQAPAAVPAAAPAAAAAAVAAGPHDAHDPSRHPRGRVVAVAVSGGVDSAVSALLLQQQGYQLFGVYMHNWDAADEAGAGTPTCTSEADLADAQELCKALGIPLYQADFVSRYWNDVFEAFLQGLSRGLTPNPDLACNSHIKFGALLQFAREKGADLLATGHYARLGWAPASDSAAAVGQHVAALTAAASAAGELPGAEVVLGAPAVSDSSGLPAGDGGAAAWRPVLLAGSDPGKDQSYFLAGLTQQQLAHAMFPVGHLTKAQVREAAAAAGFPLATKRSSAGICFIGRRSFGKFLEAYLPPRPGKYVDADTGAVRGPCSNMLAVTVGQKALGLGGQAERVYVVGKDLDRGLVHVAAGHDHPALYSSRVLLQAPNWVAGQPPQVLSPLGGGVAGAVVDSCPDNVAGGGVGDVGSGSAAEEAAQVRQLGRGQASDAAEAAGAVSGVLRCQYQARYRQAAAGCAIWALTAAEAAAFQASRFCSSPSQSGSISSRGEDARVAAARTAAAAAGMGLAGSLQEGVAGQGGSAQAEEFLLAELAVPLRGVAPGQMFVMYDGDVCLGSATIVAHGPTLAECTSP